MKSMLLCAAAAVSLLAATSASAQSPKQGGAAIVAFNNELSTLDPQIGYDWQNWSVIKSIFDGLMDYKPGTTELEPDLAESYTISDDGQTYTFKLRDDIKFHNGRAMTAGDIKYSVERAINPATQGPGAGFFGSTKGYDEMVGDAKATELSGITTPDDKTVVIQLTRPDATFLHVMAINFSYAVPKEEVDKFGADFGRNPVGTGAFKLVEWVPGPKTELERFADYYRQGVPYLDKLTFEFGQDPTVNVLRLKKGEIDIAGETFAAGRLLVFHPGDRISILATSQARLMLLGGAPMDGPRHIWWNFVSSSKDRIDAAKADWAAKRFDPVPTDREEFIPLPE